MPNKSKLIKNLKHYNTDSRNGRLNIFYDIQVEGYFTDLPVNMDISSSESDSFYKVDIKNKDRLDLIANAFYKNSRLWWVIAEANGIDDPFVVPVGTSLVIPSSSSIFGTGGVLGG
jgi:nucleoid-associated protein YgaU